MLPALFVLLTTLVHAADQPNVVMIVGDDQGVPNVLYIVDQLPAREEMFALMPDEDQPAGYCRAQLTQVDAVFQGYMKTISKRNSDFNERERHRLELRADAHWKREGKDEAEIIRLLIAHTEPELREVAGDDYALKRYEIATNYPMTVQGYMRYWRKKHPERLWE